MFDLINVIKPYNLKYIDDIDKSLIFYKNILRIISKKKCFEHDVDYIFPVRWSQKKLEFVIDFRTQKKRDINGISGDCVNDYYSENSSTFYRIKKILDIFNNSKDNKYWDDINIKKNESKFISILVNDKHEKIYLDGIYNFCHYKNRIGSFTTKNNRSILVNNSLETKNNIYQCLDSDLVLVPRNYKSTFYLESFNEFKHTFLNKNYKVSFNEEIIEINIYNNYKSKFSWEYSNSTCKDIILNKNTNKKNFDCKNILRFLIYKEFSDYIKNITGFSSIIVYDHDLEKNILIKDFILNKQVNKKTNNNNLNYFGVF